MEFLLSFLFILFLQLELVSSFTVGSLKKVPKFTVSMSGQTLPVMINGLPGPMALEAAKACVDRGYQIISTGFTGPDTHFDNFEVQGAKNNFKVSLQKGPGISLNAVETLKQLKSQYPNLIIVDYTHPSAAINNIKAYIDSNCDFVMGTTGFDVDTVNRIFSDGSNYAVIAPNMAKQIVALQSAIQQTAERFPNAFSGYNLKVSESHQSTKADTSGTAKAIVQYLSQLNGEKFGIEDIKKIRVPEEQIAFGVPENHLKGHAYHTYQFTSLDGSVNFKLEHNVCGRRIYAEGTADAVQFLNSIRQSNPSKRLYNMIDVLEAGAMN